MANESPNVVLSRPFSNSPSHEDMAYMSEMGAERGCPIRVPWGEQLSGINAKAQASFLTVPKCGREILPLALPETVLRLTPVSLANRP
jgi:hypothetical protein